MVKKQEEENLPTTNMKGASEEPGANIASPKKKTVEIEESVLQAILDRQKEQEEKINMLTSVADKGRLAKWDNDHRGTLIHTANLAIWKGQIILGWQKVKDEVGFIHGVLREEQVIRLFLENGKEAPKEEDVEYLTFYRNVGRIKGEIINESRGVLGDTKTLKLDDGRVFEVDVRFINI
jgi:hypothetical protein